MNPILEQFGHYGIIPVVKIDRAEDAVPLAKALCDGGLPVAEVTFRTAAAADAIAAMTKAYPEMLIGAGTVLTMAQVDAAIAAGAKFIVSPGLNPKVVSYCIEKNIPVTPGVTSPSEIEQALELGLEVVKFFPAEASGGLAKIKAMAAPYGGIRFMPTGGINADNLNSYLAYDRVLACGGSWMVSADLINAGDFAKITELTREAVAKMLGFAIKHVGINSENETEAKRTADLFSTIFGFPQLEIPASYFCGQGIEVMKTMGRGRMGHIAIMTWSVERAMAYLERNGVELDYSTLRKDAKGKPEFIYLKQDFGGFDIHLAVRRG
ncbi:MAG: bifunctional 4-hydroxy-2-oxoglutarate aldolase/2-dehydro-3-deoxy-phosphogluconate aldolase [Lachnospiraceae bacterium]|nr:bifunctional 4-hydroxy-2-oxoglutarate aldolase/2-dehydro-3-deoxy-phosphogluconate aldolase [Lachnospiraceae bacterium]